MIEILARALGFLLVMALGYILKMRKVARREDAGIFSAIVMNVTLPCAILASASSVRLGSGMLAPLLLGFLMNLVMDGVGYWEAYKRGDQAQRIGLVQISGYNIGTFTLPFVQAFFPVSYLVPVLLFDTGNAFMVLGGNYTLASGLDRNGERMGITTILRHLFGSVPFAIYLLIFILSTFGLQIPSQLLSASSIAANANPFLAMLMLGVMIEIKIEKEDFIHLIRLLIIRLTVSSIAAAAIFFLLPAPLITRQMIVICIFSPISVVAPVYAQKLGSQSSEPANLNSLCILVHLVIMTILVLLFAK
ncbi:AEC family transporter [Streptococcus ovis]|uniref:AEC family transporter n=1 Tax=Streptococcus ovis TaxID=82806 RepID=UPI0003746424|nr:hypothetical protein [Streptococcus ovis]